jgi:hypothetical protein
MDQAGWLTVESLMAYAHDVPDVRRAVVDQLPIGISATQKQDNFAGGITLRIDRSGQPLENPAKIAKLAIVVLGTHFFTKR